MDTIRVDPDKTTCITDGMKSPKETLFFLNTASEKKPSKAPPAKSIAALNGSPAKNKTVGGKVLRNKTRSAAQEEVMQSNVAKITEHQRDLHAAMQERGVARFAEDATANSGKEGKTWKRFQSYKGEAALPPQVEQLRVCVNCTKFDSS